MNIISSNGAVNQNGQKNTGLFLVQYQIGAGIPGAAALNISMTVLEAAETLQGFGTVTQAVNPPVNLDTAFSGSFGYVVFGATAQIIVKADGYAPVCTPAYTAAGAAVPENFQLQMTLNSDWQSGVANFKFRTGLSESDWTVVTNAPVQAINAGPVSAPVTDTNIIGSGYNNYNNGISGVASNNNANGGCGLPFIQGVA